MLRRSVAQVILALTVVALGVVAAQSPAAADGIGVGYVQPAQGDVSTKFSWRVKFYEHMNAPPDLVEVAIFDEQTDRASWHTMWEYEPWDTNVRDGKWYTYSCYLGAGTYRYRFRVNFRGNLYFHPRRYSPTQWGWFCGPEVSPVFQADITLEEGGVSPSVGTDLTDFTWQVNYFGPNNQPPDAVWVAIYSQSSGTIWRQMSPMEPSDTYYRDGAAYAFTMRGLDSSTHAYRFAAQRDGQWAYYPQPAGYYLSGPTASSTAERHIRDVFRRLCEDMNAQNRVAALTLCSDAFLHDGKVKDTLCCELDHLFAQAQNCLCWELTDLCISVNGTQATASYSLAVRRGSHAMLCGDVTASEDPLGLACLRREGNAWRFCGNQATYGAEAKGGSEEGPQNWIELFVWDDTAGASSVTASGPGIAGSLPLTYESRFDRTGWWLDVDVTGLGLTTPVSYTVTVTDAGGPTVLTPEVTAFLPVAPSKLAPTGVITGDVTFSWWAPFSVEHFTVQMFGPGGEELWQAQDLLGSSVLYDGPPLTDEALYTWRVRAFDMDDNFSQGTEVFRYVSPPP